MTDPRNALDVPAVMERFSVAAQLLDDAAARVRALGVAAESATDNASTLGEAAQSLTTAAGMMGEVVAGMKAAHDALDETMTLAREFLKSTDVSAVRETLRQVEERVSGLEQASTGVTEKVSQIAADQERWFGTISAAVDRATALERERDAAQQQLARAMEQLPSRVKKKIGSI
jgi:DNA-binding ferritin-like protein